jgi:hypothetical protein
MELLADSASEEEASMTTLSREPLTRLSLRPNSETSGCPTALRSETSANSRPSVRKTWKRTEEELLSPTLLTSSCEEAEASLRARRTLLINMNNFDKTNYGSLLGKQHMSISNVKS